LCSFYSDSIVSLETKMISIVIPTYNYGHYLAETLQSVCNQTYSDWECIIIDDESLDDTSAVVAPFLLKDNRFKYFRQNNQGVSAARNNGIKLAKGDFIQFIDGDDLLQPNKLNSQVIVFKNNKDIDIVYNDVRFFDDKQPLLFKTSLKGNKNDNWLPRISKRGADVVGLFSSINFIVINAPLVRKSVFDKVGYFNEEMKALEDWDFWMRCALNDCYFHFNDSPDSFALVRVHTGSLSTIKPLMNKGHFMFLRNALMHKNLRYNYRFILFVKYVELFWDSVFSKGFVSFDAFLLSFASLLLLPVYFLIKLFRLLK